MFVSLSAVLIAIECVLFSTNIGTSMRFSRSPPCGNFRFAYRGRQ